MDTPRDALLGPSPLQAAQAVERAEHAARTVSALGRRWVRVYLTTWATVSVLLVLAVGPTGPLGAIIGTSIWTALLVIGVIWASRQGATPKGVWLRIGLAGGAWGIVYAATLVIGLSGLRAASAYWVAGALMSALPLLIAAWMPYRHGATRRST